LARRGAVPHREGVAAPRAVRARGAARARSLARAGRTARQHPPELHRQRRRAGDARQPPRRARRGATRRPRALGRDGRSPRARDRRRHPHGPRVRWPAAPERVRRRAPPSGLVALLRAAVQAVADRDELASEVIASARDLDALVARATAKGGEPASEEPALLQGWRRTLVGDTLLAI